MNLSNYEFVLEALADSKIVLSFSIHNGASRYWTCLWIGDHVTSESFRKMGINPRVQGRGCYGFVEGLSEVFSELRFDMRTSLYIIGFLGDYSRAKNEGITCTYPSCCPSRNTDIPLTSVMCGNCFWGI